MCTDVCSCTAIDIYIYIMIYNIHTYKSLLRDMQLLMVHQNQMFGTCSYFEFRHTHPPRATVTGRLVSYGSRMAQASKTYCLWWAVAEPEVWEVFDDCFFMFTWRVDYLRYFRSGSPMQHTYGP